MKMTGAEIFIECLKREGVKTLFALPGGVVLKIFDMFASYALLGPIERVIGMVAKMAGKPKREQPISEPKF